MLTMSKQNTPAGRRYFVRTMVFMSGYVAVMLATIFGAFDAIQGKPVAGSGGVGAHRRSDLGDAELHA